MLQGRVTVPYAAAVAALAALTAAAFAPSYADLAPLAGSDSPESALLVIPVIAFLLLARKLADAARNGAEAGVNAIFAAPFLVVLVTVLVWLPVKFSYFYWVYRFDLLAVPVFVALCVLMLFGVPAVWAARRAFLLLFLGWPPLLDLVVRQVAPPLARAQAAVAGAAVSPLTHHASRAGETFLFRRPGGSVEALTVGTACSGLVGLFSMALVAGTIAALVRGPRRRKLWWLATALALALLANVARLGILVVVADGSGVKGIEGVYHATTGAVLFAAFLVVALLLLRPFGLRLPDVSIPRIAPLTFRRKGLLGVGALLAVATAISAWATTGIGFDSPGLFSGVPALTRTALVGPAAHYSVAGEEELLSIESAFGRGSYARVYHYLGSNGQRIAAQVVVAPSYYTVRAFGVLDCFVVHNYRILSVHRTALPGGGNLTLIAMQIDGRDVATANWLQPVTVDGSRAWRRSILFQYLDSANPEGPVYRPTSSRSFGLWLIDQISPYGGQHPPKRFSRAELDLADLAGRLAQDSATGRGTSA